MGLLPSSSSTPIHKEAVTVKVMRLRHSPMKQLDTESQETTFNYISAEIILLRL
jgi:hypothetical protein